jgi:hypothetical protein
MEKLKLSAVEEQIYGLYYNGLSIKEFEQWVYSSSELESLLLPEDYLAIISLNYSSRHIKNDLESIINRYVDYGKFETNKLVCLLNRALIKDENTGPVLRQFYELYCDGYYFLFDLGLGYGLACEVPIKYADTWEELSDEQRRRIIDGFYPHIISDVQRALEWLETGKIVLTGTKNEINHWQFIDNRDPDEKISSIESK